MREHGRRSNSFRGSVLGNYYVHLPQTTRIFGLQGDNIGLWRGESDQVSRREIDEVLAGQATQSMATAAQTGEIHQIEGETYDPTQVLEDAREEVRQYFAGEDL